MSENKCVFLYRSEQWNQDAVNLFVGNALESRATLFFTMDYFDFCLAITPESDEELLGHYDGATGKPGLNQIEDTISSFNKTSSSRQTFSFYGGKGNRDPFNQDCRFLIITTVSMNPMALENLDREMVFEKVNQYKAQLNQILQQLPDEDVYDVYHVLSNEDFAVVVATDQPERYFTEILPKIRAVKAYGEQYILFAHTYTILSYAFFYDEQLHKYLLRGKSSSSACYLLRGRMSRQYWERFQAFPQVEGKFQLADVSNLIGKYNVILKVENHEFEQLICVLLEKKLGVSAKSPFEIIGTPIRKLEDIRNYILSGSFSYVNERMIFKPLLTSLLSEEADPQSEKPGLKGKESDAEFSLARQQAAAVREKDLTPQNSELKKSKAEKMFSDYRTEIERQIRRLKAEWKEEKNKSYLNNLYRLNKIYECCVAMSRSLHLVPTALYILRAIQLLLKEAEENYQLLKGDKSKQEAFLRYLNSGTEAAITLFAVFSDKTYDNLQAPNYDVDDTYATEKVLRAYAEVLLEFCRIYREKLMKSKNARNYISSYVPLVIPDSNGDAVYMQILFRDAAIRENSLRIEKEGEKREESEPKEKKENIRRFLLINSPFDRQILDAKEYFRLLFHEQGHYMPPENRWARNHLFIIYLRMRQMNETVAIIENVLQRDYEWNIVDSGRERPLNDRYLMDMAECFVQPFYELYEQMLRENLFDIYADQVRNITKMLCEPTVCLHKYFQESCSGIKKLLKNFQNEGVRREVAKLEKTNEECLQKLYAISKKDIQPGAGDIFYEDIQAVFNARLEDKEIQEKEYLKSCKALANKLTEILRKKGEELRRDAEEYFPEGMRADFRAIFDHKENVSLDTAKEKFQELFDRLNGNTQERLRLESNVRAILDFYEEADICYFQQEYILERMSDVKNKSVDFTGEAKILQERWIDAIRGKCQDKFIGIMDSPTIFVARQWDPVFRKIGLLGAGCRIQPGEIEQKKCFRVFATKVLEEYARMNRQIFGGVRYAFREATADYIMYRICDRKKISEYVKQSRAYIEKLDDYNVDRVMMVLLMAKCQDFPDMDLETFQDNAFAEIPDDANYRRIFLRKWRAFFEYMMESGAENLIGQTVIAIDQTAEDFHLPMIGQQEDSGEGTKMDSLFEFFLNYYYRSRITVIKEGGVGNAGSEKE